MNDPNNKTHYHNKGQEDGSNNDYNKPHDALDFLLASEETAERYEEENQAYDEGWDNARDNA